MPSTLSAGRAPASHPGASHTAWVDRVVATHPTLTVDAEQRLLRDAEVWAEYRRTWAAEHGDAPLPHDLQLPPRARRGKDAHDRLVLAHVRLVEYVARKLRTPAHVSHEDLVAVGMHGLIEAVDGFDARRSCRLKTYATVVIRNAMHDWLALTSDLIVVPAGRRSVERRVAYLVHNRTAGGTPLEGEALLAAYVSAHGKRVAHVAREVIASGAYDRRRTGSLEALAEQSGGEPLAVSTDAGPETVAVNADRARALDVVLRTVLVDADGVLDQDAYDVAAMTYGLGDPDGKRWTVAEIAEMMGWGLTTVAVTQQAVIGALRDAADHPAVADLRAYIAA